MPLLQCNTTLTNFNQDENISAYRNGINECQYCAWDPNGINVSCQGDSGEPLQIARPNSVTAEIVGVVSFGSGCGAKLPRIYTRVASYINWIGSNVWPNGKIEPPLMNEEYK